MRSGAPATYPIAKETRYDNRKDLLPPPQRGGLVRLDRLRRAGGGYNFTEGVNHLNGEAALCFSRERYAFADGDNQRGKNQMAVIQAIISKASSPAVLKNYQTLLSSLSDAFITSLSYDDIASLVQMQLQDMSGWHVTSYAVSGSGDTSYCYALGDAAWVMRPNMDTVNTAKELIRQVMSGETPQIP